MRYCFRLPSLLSYVQVQVSSDFILGRQALAPRFFPHLEHHGYDEKLVDLAVKEANLFCL